MKSVKKTSPRIARWAAVALAAVLPVIGVDSASAHTALEEGAATEHASAAVRHDSYVNKVTARCIDDSLHGLRSLECNSLTFQSWEYDTRNRRLKNRNTQACIDDSKEYGLRALPCNSWNYQSWDRIAYDDGAVVLKNANTGRCLDDSFAYGLRAIKCNSLDFQRWYPRYGA